MSIVVQKYGGSSVADTEKIRAVARRVMRTQAAGHAVCVVVSAMGDTTDDLLARAKQLSANPPRRELDMLLSAGERIAMALLSIAVRELGGDAISFTGSQSGIITNDRHSDARIIEVRPFRVQDELERGRIVVVAGYQGVSYRREVTTLGRGGSDTTAVALAAALGAAWCEICSDVDGVYSADPRVVPAARRLAELTYEESQEMAEAGARVLNAQAVEFAKEKGIAIYARATAQGPPVGAALDPAAEGGTVVRRFAPRQPGSVAAVVSEEDVLVLRHQGAFEPLLARLETLGAVGKQLHLARFFAGPDGADGEGSGNGSGGGGADEEGGPGASRPLPAKAEGELTLVFSRENLHQEEALRRALDVAGAETRFVDGLGTISAIGTGINASYRNVLAGSARLAELGIAVHGLATTSFRISWLVARRQVAAAVRALHALYVEGRVDLLP